MSEETNDKSVKMYKRMISLYESKEEILADIKQCIEEYSSENFDHKAIAKAAELSVPN